MIVATNELLIKLELTISEMEKSRVPFSNQHTNCAGNLCRIDLRNLIDCIFLFMSAYKRLLIPVMTTLSDSNIRSLFYLNLYQLYDSRKCFDSFDRSIFRLILQ